MGYEEKIEIKKIEIEPNLSLILSGGGARGIAQLGIIEGLEKTGIKINSIVGTSMGSVIGGLYASGYSAEQIIQIFDETDWNELFSISENQQRSEYYLDQKQLFDRRLLTLRFKDFKYQMPKAVNSGDKFNYFLQKNIWEAPIQSFGNFDSLLISYRAVATDLVTAKSISFSCGSLINSIRASSNVPLRYNPIYLDSMILVDGGLMSNIPTKEADEFKPDFKLAVNTMSPLYKINELDAPWKIADQVVSTVIADYALKSIENSNLTITPDINDYSNLDFSKVKWLVDKGRDEFNANIQSITKKLDSISSYKIGKILGKNINFSEYNSIHLSDGISDKTYKNSNELYQDLTTKFKQNNCEKIVFNIKSNSKILDIEINSIEEPRIKNINLIGIDYFSLDNKMKAVITSYIDSYYNELNIEKIKRGISYGLRQANNKLFDLSNFKFEKGILNIKVTKFKLNKFIIEGNENIAKSIVLRELLIKKNEEISSEDLLNSWENLSSTQLFDYILFDFIKKDSDKVDLQIRLTEKPSQLIQIGARVDNERYTQLTVDLIAENISKIVGKLNLSFMGGFRNQRFDVSLFNNRILANLGYNLNVYYDSRDINQYTMLDYTNSRLPRNRFDIRKSYEFTEERYGSKFTLSGQINKNARLDFGFRYEEQRANENDSLRFSRYTTLSTIRSGLTFDTQDNIDFPTKGSYLFINIESSLFAKEKITSFSKADFIYRQIASFGSHTIIPSIRFGGADRTMQRMEFFRLGGENLFYGMREEEQRGRQLFVSSLEYRYKLPFQIFFNTYLSFRYDLGNVWVEPENIKLSGLKHGIGASMAVDTPLGPAKLSFGRRFYFVNNPDGAIYGPIMGYFSFGIRY